MKENNVFLRKSKNIYNDVFFKKNNNKFQIKCFYQDKIIRVIEKYNNNNDHKYNVKKIKST